MMHIYKVAYSLHEIFWFKEWHVNTFCLFFAGCRWNNWQGKPTEISVILYINEDACYAYDQSWLNVEKKISPSCNQSNYWVKKAATSHLFTPCSSTSHLFTSHLRLVYWSTLKITNDLPIVAYYYAFVIVSLTWLAYFLSHDYFSYINSLSF